MLLDVAALGGRLRRRTRPTPRPDPADGCVEELSTGHVAGWIRDPADPSRRVHDAHHASDDAGYLAVRAAVPALHT